MAWMGDNAYWIDERDGPADTAQLAHEIINDALDRLWRMDQNARAYQLLLEQAYAQVPYSLVNYRWSINVQAEAVNHFLAEIERHRAMLNWCLRQAGT